VFDALRDAVVYRERYGTPGLAGDMRKRTSRAHLLSDLLEKTSAEHRRLISKGRDGSFLVWLENTQVQQAHEQLVRSYRDILRCRLMRRAFVQVAAFAASVQKAKAALRLDKQSRSQPDGSSDVQKMKIASRLRLPLLLQRRGLRLLHPAKAAQLLLHDADLEMVLP